MAGSRVKEGDVLLNITGASLGRSCVARLNRAPANVNQHVCVIRPRRSTLKPSFLAAVVSSQSVQTQIFNTENGISRDALNFQQIGQLRVTCPTLGEQDAIAAFLDRETARIDALVAKKEQLIELLHEKCTALITRAVIKGLDPNAPMKDSGVEWLGQIPAHWKIVRLKHLTLDVDSGIQMGPFGSMLKELLFSDTGYKLYGQENTISGDFRAGSRWLSEHQYCDLKLYRLKPGDIVLTRKGSIGNARLLPNDLVPGVIDSDTIRLRVDLGTIDPRLLVLLLHEADYVHQQIDAIRRGAVLSGLNTTTIANLIIVVPPLNEQALLVQRIRRMHAEIEELITKIRLVIDHLRELRLALISAAVTGKIDVREEAA
jgi:type I restriction enzyme S subunit